MDLQQISDAFCFISHYHCEIDGICRSFNRCHYLVLAAHVGALVALCLVIYSMYVIALMMYAWVDEPVNEKELDAYLADTSGEKPKHNLRRRAERVEDKLSDADQYKSKLRRRNVPKTPQKVSTPQMHGDAQRS